eukprot:Gregarina_sp_Poly_1__4753@NODE_2538_length_2010_cov_23_987133_g1613_i0_p2_GENE_NODE_2538_length_2010_cov_23_987133_g1613_i0NODE_2538_length_2010_cov_23_987133_g1613_i0_p2_ORF_typecomplete_len157_score2_52YbgT_YccB/PF08173_11/0_18_NODE_2538_length_2010_cov_23_987133_g1613_i012071677
MAINEVLSILLACSVAMLNTTSGERPLCTQARLKAAFETLSPAPFSFSGRAPGVRRGNPFKIFSYTSNGVSFNASRLRNMASAISGSTLKSSNKLRVIYFRTPPLNHGIFGLESIPSFLRNLCVSSTVHCSIVLKNFLFLSPAGNRSSSCSSIPIQ